MSVTPLATPPVPQNSNLIRSVIAWVTTDASQDPLATDTSMQNFVNFCGTNGCNRIYLDMFNYLGANNWTSAKLTRLRKFLVAAKGSGIEVYALAGSPDWCHAQSWVMKNIIQNVKWFNEQAAAPGDQFDGFHYDVEYWNDSAGSQANCPALCDMMRVTRNVLGIPVGCTATYWLKDNTGSWPTITYKGVTAQDGAFLVDEADELLVPCYRNHAQDNGTDGAGQITLFQAWNDYAATAGNAKPILCASETTNVTPAYVTYYGLGKAAMEAQHTLISNQFISSANAIFIGQCVHSYDGWKAMGA